MEPLKLNPGAQENFVRDRTRYSAFIGGLGSGKTYAGLAKGIALSLQPRPEGAYHGPRGLVAAISYPVLYDVVLPLAEELVEQTGVGDWQRGYMRSEKKLRLHNGGEILFRSLDDPNRIRGVELAWAFMDEGRHLSAETWKIVVGRLRQKGYDHKAFVCSTPNGYDWMWRNFHQDSPEKWKDAVWYGAPTTDNRRNLPPSYIPALEGAYEGRFYEQEVLGRFVGVVSGSVFPFWDPMKHLSDVEYNPHLPLFHFWDFGIGDPGVCIFAQIDWVIKEVPSGEKVKVPVLYLLDVIEAKDWTSADWAGAFHAKLALDFPGAGRPRGYGDPAGMQRNAVTGTSVIDDLQSRDVDVTAAHKRPQDYAIRILSNMMAGDRVLASKGACDRLSAALASHKWNLDANGVRIGVNAVHDWTSHYVDALRYGVGQLLDYRIREVDETVEARPYTESEYGHVFEQLLNKDEQVWLNQPKRGKPTFTPRPLLPRSAQ